MHSPASETRSSGFWHMQSTSCTSQPIADTALVMQVTYFCSLVHDIFFGPDFLSVRTAQVGMDVVVSEAMSGVVGVVFTLSMSAATRVATSVRIVFMVFLFSVRFGLC